MNCMWLNVSTTKDAYIYKCVCVYTSFIIRNKKEMKIITLNPFDKTRWFFIKYF